MEGWLGCAPLPSALNAAPAGGYTQAVSSGSGGWVLLDKSLCPLLPSQEAVDLAPPVKGDAALVNKVAKFPWAAELPLIPAELCCQLGPCTVDSSPWADGRAVTTNLGL